MSQKKYFFLLLILFISFIEILSFKQNKDDLNQKNSYKKNNKRRDNTSSDNENSYFGNPYFILKIPPWSKFKDIKKRYIKLRETAKANNKINSDEFQKYKKAYRSLEEEYEKNEYKENTFFGVLFNTIKNIILYELVMLFLLLISWLVYKFNKYAALLVVTFVTIDNIIPHWFSTMFTQYIVSFILGTIIYFKDFFYSFIFNKKVDDNDNNINSNNNIGGGRKRRRFVKVE